MVLAVSCIYGTFRYLVGSVFEQFVFCKFVVVSVSKSLNQWFCFASCDKKRSYFVQWNNAEY